MSARCSRRARPTRHPHPHPHAAAAPRERASHPSPLLPSHPTLSERATVVAKLMSREMTPEARPSASWGQSMHGWREGRGEEVCGWCWGDGWRPRPGRLQRGWGRCRFEAKEFLGRPTRQPARCSRQCTHAPTAATHACTQPSHHRMRARPAGAAGPPEASHSFSLARWMTSSVEPYLSRHCTGPAQCVSQGRAGCTAHGAGLALGPAATLSAAARRQVSQARRWAPLCSSRQQRR